MAPALEPTPEPARAPDVGKAFDLAALIMTERRDPTEAEAATIGAAIRSVAEPLREAFKPWRAFLAARGEVATALARRQIELQARADLAERWKGRPARWRALPPMAQLALSLASSFADSLDDGRSVSVGEVHRALLRVADDVLRPEQGEIPWTYEFPLLQEAQRAGIARRDGRQAAND